MRDEGREWIGMRGGNESSVVLDKSYDCLLSHML